MLMCTEVDGVLLLDKPAGLTSNAALQCVRRVYGAARAGHAGTLDPLASGLLPILLGEATKFSSAAIDEDKEYLVVGRLGWSTTTGDAEGEPLERCPAHIERHLVEPVLARFHGAIRQCPPMYSAVKLGGRPLYELARQGHTVTRAPREVYIRRLSLLSLSQDTMTLRVRCSKGTYVRVLIEDIGVALGSAAHVTALRRTGAGSWRIDDACALDRLIAANQGERERLLMAPGAALQGWPEIRLGPVEATRFLQGQVIVGVGAVSGRVAVFGGRRELLGIGAARDGQLRPIRTARRP